MNGLPYYKRYPRDFLEGTVGMPIELKGPYAIILDLIYLQNGKLPDDPHYISGALGCSVRKWNSLRKRLLECGKINARDGVISQLRADKEIIISSKYQEQQAENRRGSSKNKGLEKRRSNHTDTDTIIDTLEANASNGASADFSAPIDATKDAIWRRGVPFLIERGVVEAQAREMIGKWIRDHGSGPLYDALTVAAKSGTHAPIPYITKILTQPSTDDVMRGILERTADAVRRAN